MVFQGSHGPRGEEREIESNNANKTSQTKKYHDIIVQGLIWQPYFILRAAVRELPAGVNESPCYSLAASQSLSHPASEVTAATATAAWLAVVACCLLQVAARELLGVAT
jgi:hypothetical protein